MISEQQHMCVQYAPSVTLPACQSCIRWVALVSHPSVTGDGPKRNDAVSGTWLESTVPTDRADREKQKIIPSRQSITSGKEQAVRLELGSSGAWELWELRSLGSLDTSGK